jgi:hypothetical protein
MEACLTLSSYSGITVSGSTTRLMMFFVVVGAHSERDVTVGLSGIGGGKVPEPEPAANRQFAIHCRDGAGWDGRLAALVLHIYPDGELLGAGGRGGVEGNAAGVRLAGKGGGVAPPGQGVVGASICRSVAAIQQGTS